MEGGGDKDKGNLPPKKTLGGRILAAGQPSLSDKVSVAGHTLRRQRGQRAASSPLFNVRYTDWVKLFLQCANVMGLEKKGSSLHPRHHGGTSYELLHSLRDVTGVKKRGRLSTTAAGVS
eukprot:6465701-Amphidinium_carterae.1